jgi:hypothetical protein
MVKETEGRELNSQCHAMKAGQKLNIIGTRDAFESSFWSILSAETETYWNALRDRRSVRLTAPTRADERSPTG